MSGDGAGMPCLAGGESMTEIIVILWLVAGLISAVLSHGMSFAYVQLEFPSTADKQYREDLGNSLLMALFCLIIPPMLVVPLTSTGFCKHGMKWK